MRQKITQEEILKEFYRKHPHRDIKHPEVVDWVMAQAEGNTQLIDFCTQVLETFEAHDINGHIEWKR